MIEPGRGGAKRQVGRQQRRRRHLHGHGFSARPVGYDTGMRPCQGGDDHLERRLARATRKVQRRTAKPVAAHLGHRAIGVDHVHRRRGDIEDEDPVAPYSAMPITERDRLIGREQNTAKRFLLDDEEVVSETFVFVEGQEHPGRVLRLRARRGKAATLALFQKKSARRDCARSAIATEKHH